MTTLHPQISVSLAKSPSIPVQSSAPEPTVLANTAQYAITISTSDMPGAGTDCTAYIAISGDQGNTGKQVLSAEEGRFLRGIVQSCEVAGLNVGRMSHICIGHNDDGMKLCLELGFVCSPCEEACLSFTMTMHSQYWLPYNRKYVECESESTTYVKMTGVKAKGVSWLDLTLVCV